MTFLRSTLKRSGPPKRTKGLKPKRKAKTKDAVKVYRDGREVCQNNAAGDAEYKRRIKFMHDRDNGICCFCGRYVPLDAATMEHTDGRGLGGARRDDRVENNRIAHGSCNGLAGSPKRNGWRQEIGNVLVPRL